MNGCDAGHTLKHDPMIYEYAHQIEGDQNLRSRSGAAPGTCATGGRKVWTPMIVVVLAMVAGWVSTAKALSYTAAPLPGAEGQMNIPPLPGSGDYDWVHFKNGEWLKGKIEDLQDSVLLFKSAKLKTVELDLDDIYALYSADQVLCLFADKASVRGRLRIEGDRVNVDTENGQRTSTRSDLRSIVPARTERDYWSLRWSSGFTLRSGNTEQSDVASFLMVQRRSPLARTRLELNTSYSVSEGKEVTNNHRAALGHDIFLTPKVYVPSSLQYYRDKIQNISSSWTPGLGIGYQVLDRHDVEWGVDVGAGYQYTRYDEVAAGESVTVGGASLLAGTRLSWELTKKLDFDLQYNAMVGLSNYVSTNHHALAQLSYDVWKDLDFDVSLAWDRVGDPQKRKDGTRPQSDDIRLYVGFGFDF
jgi:putative salt-induced outer membrane protein YdiY